MQSAVLSSAWVGDTEDALVRSLSRRIEHATGLSMETAEQLHVSLEGFLPIAHPTEVLFQLSCYGIGGHYEPHYDYYRVSQTGVLLS